MAVMSYCRSGNFRITKVSCKKIVLKKFRTQEACMKFINPATLTSSFAGAIAVFSDISKKSYSL